MHKKILKFSFFFFFVCLSMFSQTGINTKSPRVTLDVVADIGNKSTPQGLIAPQVTIEYLIENDALYGENEEGTIIYVHDISNSDIEDRTPATTAMLKDGYYYFDGSKWVLFVIPDSVEIPSEPWRVDSTGSEATTNTENIVQNAKVGVGFSNAIDESAQLEIRSSNKGLLIPRMTTQERNGILSPTNALLIFNTDTSCFNFLKKDKWKSLCGDLGDAEISVPNCASAIILGDYKVGNGVNNTNYFQITLNVLEEGNYSILVNNPTAGFFFQKEGTFPNVGIYTIQIPGIGAPTTAGINQFSIQINDEIITCTATVDVSAANVNFNNIVFVSADGLLRGQSSIGKKMTITVDVLDGGSFNFQTNSVNGLAYSTENVILDPGANQTVILYANGNPPAAAGTFSYTLTGSGYSGTQTVSGEVIVGESAADISSINCGSVIVNGLFRLDTPLTASNYIDIPVTSTTTGTYTVSVASSENPGFVFNGSGNISSIGTSIIRVYGSGSPIKAGTIPFVVTVNGKTCNLNLTVVIPRKSVLMVGTSSAYMRNALNSTTNFGPNGTSKIESINLILQGNSMNATQLRAAINTQGVQVILIGWSWNPNAECITILSNFIKNKKGFVYWVESQGDGDYIESLLNQTYNGNVTVTNDTFAARTAKFDTAIPTSNPYLNGVFGDANGKYLRADDNASWVGFVPSTLPSDLTALMHLPANGGTGTASNSERLTQVYGQGFFMFSDWGFLNNNSSTYGTNTPIGFSTASVSGNSSNGTTVTSQTIPAGQVANWVVFGNAMDFIFNYVQQNFNPAGSL